MSRYADRAMDFADATLVHLANRESLSAILTDRKSTRLNSSHGYISYAVFCSKKKKAPRGDRRALEGRPQHRAPLPEPPKQRPAAHAGSRAPCLGYSRTRPPPMTRRAHLSPDP